MRASLLMLTACIFWALASTTQADAGLEEFKARIETALSIEDEDRRISAVGTLFARDSLDEWTENLAKRTIKRLADLYGRDIAFAPLSPETETLHVVDGYEYKPNIEPLGQVVFTDPAATPGNNTKVMYGLHPKENRYSFPVTVRQLVNSDAPPDKQLQMLAMGAAHPPVTFEGWCDIALSNNTTKRVKLDDQNVGNQTRIMRGQSIEGCELTNTSGRGSLSLRLYEGDRTIFEQSIETPRDSIVYRKP